MVFWEGVCPGSAENCDFLGFLGLLGLARNCSECARNVLGTSLGRRNVLGMCSELLGMCSEPRLGFWLGSMPSPSRSWNMETACQWKALPATGRPCPAVSISIHQGFCRGVDGRPKVYVRSVRGPLFFLSRSLSSFDLPGFPRPEDRNNRGFGTQRRGDS